MVEAGRAQGRAAMSHFFNVEGEAGATGFSGMADI
jgi:hypothetical protein